VALKWTSKAHSDLVRLHDFLAPINAPVAIRVVRQLLAGAKRIPTNPRLGVRLPEFHPREVRRVFIGDYEIRYEVVGADVYILRLFHTKEDR
jgi:plasmid stabilization system protein ParE